jgi:hypothetical protein
MRSNLKAVFICAVWLMWVATAMAQTRLDLNKPEDALKAMQKIQCSLEDGRPVIYWWRGSVYSRVPGERDRHLFNIEGMNIRACQSLNDPQRGYGYRQVSREILLYLDAETNRVLRRWKNPFTGQENEVIHVANDPVNSPPSYAVGATGQPYKFTGTVKNGRVWTQVEVPLFYKNPLGGEYQEYVGGTYHAMEMFTFFTHERELLDASQKHSDDVTVSWARTSQWLPWMEMGDRPGMMIFTAVGRRLLRFDDLSETMKAELKQQYPIYNAPPPLDDNRPNETSWTYFKKILAAKKSGQPIPGVNAPAPPAEGLATAVARAGQLDPSKPEEIIKIERKMHCSTEDGKPALYWWHGRVYSRVPGERDRLLFNVHGFNVRACKGFNDPQRGPGYRSVSREMLIYTDPQTGQVLRAWKNPWTGEEVEVLHVANDPVNMREPSFARDKDGKPLAAAQLGFVKDGRLLTGGGAARLFYKNPLGGDYQENVGGWYHAMEFTTSEVPLDDLLDAKATAVTDRVLTWVRISKWLPWMKMGDRPGVVIFHTAGMRVSGWDDVPEVVRNEVKRNWPLWQEAPPIDDARPNMTSWDQFKRWMESKDKKH